MSAFVRVCMCVRESVCVCGREREQVQSSTVTERRPLPSRSDDIIFLVEVTYSNGVVVVSLGHRVRVLSANKNKTK